ncbi:MAG: hypothetical protein F4123_12275 [Gemmatimonadetes bacterium]|nr:hypothetical protein [Gemmatimonadota bacterium]MYB98972.1 hypothetical protein [Gemmatimonadota bacterium]MYI47131.1 hypothetical protein [Gemmatimonadota bacterium]
MLDRLPALLGETVDPEEAGVAKARELVQLLHAEVLPFVDLVGVTRRADAWEVVQVDVRPAVPTFPVNDIRMVEPIAVEFDPADRFEPRAITLRSDFPRVPHTYVVAPGEPPTLCLFDEPYTEQRLRWTAAAFAQRLHTWLSKTAIGTLHQPDQPVEPFLPGSPAHVILPSHLFDAGSSRGPQAISLSAIPRTCSARLTYVAGRQGSGDGIEGDRNCIAVVVETKPQTQGGLTHQPQNLLQLHEFLQTMGSDLLQTLRDNLTTWIIERAGDPDVIALVILRIPVRRSHDRAPETIEVRAFQVAGSVGRLGKALGFVDEVDGDFGAIIGDPGTTSASEEVPLLPLNPVRDLTRRRAQMLSGNRSAPDPHILAVGAGALGSQTLLNLVRTGFGTWTVVDDDVLLPHNLARHALPGPCVGHEKAGALAHLASLCFEDGGTIDSFCADVLTPPLADELRTKLDATDISLDFSASVAVARWLALEAPGDSRRISVFLNPDGTDLVVMAEDQARSMRLDCIEAQYYRAVIEREEFAEHLLENGERLRYGHTCRDVTSTLSQDSLSLFSGIAAGALRKTIAGAESSLAVWQASANHSVKHRAVDLAAPVEIQCGDWQIWTDRGVLRKLSVLRKQALPNETGGVLLGYTDHLRKVLYVVDTLPSPPDSEEWPSSYVRGCDGLKEAVDAIAHRTGGAVAYLGEWHSHPDGSTCEPSPDDLVFLAWLTGHMFVDGMPGLMAIVGEGDDVSWYTTTLTSAEDP